MKLILQGFKCYDEQEFQFENGKLLLLSGPSGIGKSTVFQSLFWVLYGSLRNVYSNNGTNGTGLKTKCSVTLSLNDYENFKVYRQKRPELLKVYTSDKCYEDEVGQQIINEKFGTKEVFLACCYLQQNEKSTLLSSSLSERMDILNLISFSGDNPEEMINRIDENLKAYNSIFLDKENTFKNLCEQFRLELEESPIDPETIEMSRNLDATLKELGEKEIELVLTKEQLEKKITEQIKICGILENLNETSKNLKTELNSIPFVSLLDCDELQKEVKTCQELIPLALQYEKIELEIIKHKTHLEKLELELSTIDPNWKVTHTQSDFTGISEKEIWSIQKVENDYVKNLNLANSLKIEYTSENLIKEIEECQQQITNINMYEKAIVSYQNYESVLKRTYDCQVQIKEYQRKITEYNEKIEKYKILLCEYPMHNLQSLKDRISSFQKFSTLQTQLNNLTSELEKVVLQLENVQIEENKFDKCHDKLEILKQILPLFENLNRYQQDYLNLEKSSNELQIKLKSLTSNLQPLLEQSEYLESEIQSLTTRLSELKKSVDILSCPHCNGSVRYYQGKIHACQEKSIKPEECNFVTQELEQKNKLLAQLKLQISLEREKESQRITISTQIEERQKNLTLMC